ncbi:hypothetical protein [Helicobacter acinonychis]|uniref:Outer membrane family protein n=1 Tax=Helicobacter acinonychis (strain Sheeba) TaxID=382638 RepID=Q17WT8_HELAH|nr:hypothetical protein [Helicobacter acinonychis]CAJ99888.1 conserved hypothetical protein [Helicobacter acinonychis str. Sheeba]STP04438.1 Uncharacterised protein [Helicobacter acinonychis]
MQDKKNKKRYYHLALWILFLNGLSLKALEIAVKPFGYLGLLYNQGAQKNPHSYVGALARLGADFSYSNGWSLGIGAIGAWNAYNKQRLADLYISLGNFFGNPNNVKPYLSAGDISDAYLQYTNQRFKIALGRFNTDFVDFDWIGGNIQGVSAAFKQNSMRYFGIFMDSMLYNGHQINKEQGNRIATSLNALASYDPVSKRLYVGGEVFVLGAEYKNKNLTFTPFILTNTRLPLPTQNVLVQVGGKFEYDASLAKGFTSHTLMHGMYQYGNTDAVTSAKNAGLFLIDQTFEYKIFNFGMGFYIVPARNNKGYLWTFNDRTKFYGRGINAPGVPAIYFANSSISGYVFGGLKTKRVRLDAMVAFGDYQEYSLMSSFRIWAYRSLSFDMGGGYVYAYNSKATRKSLGNSSFVFFGKFLF